VSRGESGCDRHAARGALNETNDNSVALLLTYVTTCALLAGDAEATEDLRVRREGDRTAIPAELNSGEYVVEVLLRVPEGDATYYFRVAVEGEGKRPVSSGSTEY
jgi:hypothetical protein